MTRRPHPAAVGRALAGAATALAFVGLVSGFQLTAAEPQVPTETPGGAVEAPVAPPAEQTAPEAPPAEQAAPEAPPASEAPAPAAPEPVPAAPAPQPAPVDATSGGS